MVGNLSKWFPYLKNGCSLNDHFFQLMKYFSTFLLHQCFIRVCLEISHRSPEIHSLPTLESIIVSDFWLVHDFSNTRMWVVFLFFLWGFGIPFVGIAGLKCWESTLLVVIFIPGMCRWWYIYVYGFMDLKPTANPAFLLDEFSVWLEKLGVFIFLERKGERPASCRGGRAKWREAKRRSISKRKRKGEGGTQKPSCQKMSWPFKPKKKTTKNWRCIDRIEYLPFFHNGDSPPCHQHVSWRATCFFQETLSLHSPVCIHQHPMQSRRAARISYNNKSLCCIMRKMFETS